MASEEGGGDQAERALGPRLTDANAQVAQPAMGTAALAWVLWVQAWRPSACLRSCRLAAAGRTGQKETRSWEGNTDQGRG